MLIHRRSSQVMEGQPEATDFRVRPCATTTTLIQSYRETLNMAPAVPQPDSPTQPATRARLFRVWPATLENAPPRTSFPFC
jgi:hypothetical protein